MIEHTRLQKALRYITRIIVTLSLAVGISSISTTVTSAEQMETSSPLSITLPTDLSVIIESLKINLPTATILPDSPFYDIKTTWEQVRLFFIKDPNQRAQFLIELGQQRLAESLSLIQKERFDLALTTLDRFTKTIDSVKAISSNSLVDAPSILQIQGNIDAQKEKRELINLVTGEYNISWER